MPENPSCERCSWAQNDPLMRDYHDAEWGVPQRDPRMLWEMLMLEGFQAGLAWITILRKREPFALPSRVSIRSRSPLSTSRISSG